MSDGGLFLFGVLVSFLWGAAVLAPILYGASRAELDAKARRRQKSILDPARAPEG
ncbi:MAG: hypothetical protein HOP18_14705 [Deltaproteobacteria bacterium]|nr:hypothetical protein [Deltaproteobacteria bacterium]